MTSPSTDNAIIDFILLVLLVMAVMYATGRLHQWFRQGRERDEAFRDGYNIATQSLFTVATQTTKAFQSTSAEATVTEISDAPSARHRAEDVMSTTRRINARNWSA